MWGSCPLIVASSSKLKDKPKPLVPSTIKQLRSVIICQALFGVQRIHLLKCSRWLKFLSYIYSILLSITIAFTICNTNHPNLLIFFLKQAFIYGYIIIVFTSLVANKRKLKRFFDVLEDFDKRMNISGYPSVVFSSKGIGFWIFVVVLLNMLLYSCLILHLHSFQRLVNTSGLFFACTIHDLEKTFFVLLLRFVYIRLLVLKRQVRSLFNLDTTLNTRSLNRIAFVMKEDTTDISFLLNMYALLNKASFLLNSVMSLPMLILFMTMGVNMLALSNMFITNSNHLQDSPLFLSYIALRWVKSSMLMVVPCCYCNMTSLAVGGIRAALYDAVYIIPMDLIERRKVKAFIQLTRSCNFKYALCKVLQLDMMLLLKFASLCLTYLIIIIQFVRFTN